jgi:hypothetical protein
MRSKKRKKEREKTEGKKDVAEGATESLTRGESAIRNPPSPCLSLSLSRARGHSVLAVFVIRGGGGNDPIPMLDYGVGLISRRDASPKYTSASTCGWDGAGDEKPRQAPNCPASLLLRLTAS